MQTDNHFAAWLVKKLDRAGMIDTAELIKLIEEETRQIFWMADDPELGYRSLDDLKEGLHADDGPLDVIFGLEYTMAEVPVKSELDELLDKAREWQKNASPEGQSQMMELQRQSLARSFMYD